MASLDKLEGEAIEGVGLLLLVAIAVIAFFIWKGVAGFKFPDVLSWLKKIADKIAASIPSPIGATNWPTGEWNYSVPSPGELDGASADWVSIGTSVGAEDLAASGGS